MATNLETKNSEIGGNLQCMLQQVLKILNRQWFNHQILICNQTLAKKLKIARLRSLLLHEMVSQPFTI